MKNPIEKLMRRKKQRTDVTRLTLSMKVKEKEVLIWALHAKDRYRALSSMKARKKNHSRVFPSKSSNAKRYSGLVAHFLKHTKRALTSKKNISCCRRLSM